MTTATKKPRAPRFAQPLADRAVKIISLFKNTKGEYAGKPFNLHDWQEKILRAIYRTGPDGKRIVREVFIFLPRKNGKSELAAAIGIHHLLFEGEKGAEAYLAATDSDQASIVYGAAAAMVRADQNLLKRCKLLDATKRIVVPGTNSFLRAIPADDAGAHGFNPSLVIYDELHAAPNRELYDVLRTGQGGRQSPLFIVITTAGFDRKSICYERYDYACKVRDGLITDPSFLPIIFEADEKDDWRNEKTWIKANPALRGKTPFRNIDEMRRMAKEAEQIVGMQNAFKRLYLNQWTTQDTRWIDGEAWSACAEELEPIDGRACFVGVDLASTTDIAAAIFLFPAPNGFFDVLARFWVPLEGARKRGQRDRVPYEQWIKDGWITATPGDVIDYDRIRAGLRELGEKVEIKQIAIDRWNATQLTTQLGGDGFDMVPIGQGFASMSAP